MRKASGWLLWLLGALLVIAGAAAVVTFGSDNTLKLGPNKIASAGPAVVSAPEIIPFSGPTVEITVRSDDPSRPIFIGVGDDIDVHNYVRNSIYTKVKEIKLPWALNMLTTEGTRVLTDPPGDLDWWLVSDQGTGTASVSLRLPESRVDVVAMDPTLGNDFSGDVTVAFVVKGSFVGGLASLVLGAGLLVFGWVLVSGGRRQVDSEDEPVAGTEPADDVEPDTDDSIATDTPDRSDEHDDPVAEPTPKQGR